MKSAKFYETPDVRIEEILVENGIAASGGPNTPPVNSDPVDDYHSI